MGKHCLFSSSHALQGRTSLPTDTYWLFGELRKMASVKTRSKVTLHNTQATLVFCFPFIFPSAKLFIAPQISLPNFKKMFTHACTSHLIKVLNLFCCPTAPRSLQSSLRRRRRSSGQSSQLSRAQFEKFSICFVVYVAENTSKLIHGTPKITSVLL